MVPRLTRGYPCLNTRWVRVMAFEKMTGTRTREYSPVLHLTNRGDDTVSVIFRICGVGWWWIARSGEMESTVTSMNGHWHSFVTKAMVCLLGPEMVRSH